MKTYWLTNGQGQLYPSKTPGQLGGNRRLKIYGRLDCPSALGWIARGFYVKNRVFFADRQTALAAGYRPCGVCLRDEFVGWKKAGAAPLPAHGNSFTGLA